MLLVECIISPEQILSVDEETSPYPVCPVFGKAEALSFLKSVRAVKRVSVEPCLYRKDILEEGTCCYLVYCPGPSGGVFYAVSAELDRGCPDAFSLLSQGFFQNAGIEKITLSMEQLSFLSSASLCTGTLLPSWKGVSSLLHKFAFSGKEQGLSGREALASLFSRSGFPDVLPSDGMSLMKCYGKIHRFYFARSGSPARKTDYAFSDQFSQTVSRHWMLPVGSGVLMPGRSPLLFRLYQDQGIRFLPLAEGCCLDKCRKVQVVFDGEGDRMASMSRLIVLMEPQRCVKSQTVYYIAEFMDGHIVFLVKEAFFSYFYDLLSYWLAETSIRYGLPGAEVVELDGR